MLSPMKVVIVGGVAAGPKVASTIIRLKPDEAAVAMALERCFCRAHLKNTIDEAGTRPHIPNLGEQTIGN